MEIAAFRRIRRWQEVALQKMVLIPMAPDNWTAYSRRDAPPLDRRGGTVVDRCGCRPKQFRILPHSPTCAMDNRRDVLFRAWPVAAAVLTY